MIDSRSRRQLLYMQYKTVVLSTYTSVAWTEYKLVTITQLILLAKICAWNLDQVWSILPALELLPVNWSCSRGATPMYAKWFKHDLPGILGYVDWCSDTYPRWATTQSKWGAYRTEASSRLSTQLSTELASSTLWRNPQPSNIMFNHWIGLLME